MDEGRGGGNTLRPSDWVLSVLFLQGSLGYRRENLMEDPGFARTRSVGEGSWKWGRKTSWTWREVAGCFCE
jgi:hypothetical protein